MPNTPIFFSLFQYLAICVILVQILLSIVLISQSISLSAAGRESRVQVILQKWRNAALSPPEAPSCYRDESHQAWHQPNEVWGVLSSPPRLVSAPAQVYGTFRLSWSRCSPPVCTGYSKDTGSSISPARSWRGNSGRSQSILQRKLGISQDTCAGPVLHQSVLCAAHNKLLLCLEMCLCM